MTCYRWQFQLRSRITKFSSAREEKLIFREISAKIQFICQLTGQYCYIFTKGIALNLMKMFSVKKTVEFF